MGLGRREFLDVPLPLFGLRHGAEGSPDKDPGPVPNVGLEALAIPDWMVDADIDVGIPAGRRAYVRKVLLSIPTVRDFHCRRVVRAGKR